MDGWNIDLDAGRAGQTFPRGEGYYSGQSSQEGAPQVCIVQEAYGPKSR